VERVAFFQQNVHDLEALFSALWAENLRLKAGFVRVEPRLSKVFAYL
jgi:hypothetical protein